MADIITYEQFCAARKAKMEKIEEQQDILDAESILSYQDAALEFYAKQDPES